MINHIIVTPTQTEIRKLEITYPIIAVMAIIVIAVTLSIHHHIGDGSVSWWANSGEFREDGRERTSTLTGK